MVAGELVKKGVQFGFFVDGTVEIEFDLLPDLRQGSCETELFFVDHLSFASAAAAVHDQHLVTGAGTEDPEEVFSLSGFGGEKFTLSADMCMENSMHPDS